MILVSCLKKNELSCIAFVMFWLPALPAGGRSARQRRTGYSNLNSLPAYVNLL